MKSALLITGVAAWASVGGIAWLSADWEEPVLGFLPILVAVVVAWLIGEYVTAVVWKQEE